ncbi:TlpA family protein disulfide reductase [Streptomyces paludis]|uniref:Thioredoxin domain-containing protein n=1 Tax=Streptomyces paludis TaxID=2282738 RepID=A0A345HNW9_9ACTN|nr:hypothetical protein [Streptomyces paludis]AXG78393.1 hypothetical protein DVK44_12485 [Streptomyces paludis]
MITSISVLAVLMASLACALSLAVALRVKKVIDPLVEEGRMGNGRPEAIPAGTLLPGTRPMTDTDGASVEFPMNSANPWILTFQSIGCSGCKQQLPRYKRHLEALKLDRSQVFSVIIGDGEEIEHYRKELNGLSHIVQADEFLNEFTESLGISVWPTYLVVTNGRVGFSANSAARLAEVKISLDSSRENTVTA